MHAADVAIDITEVDSSAMYPLGQEFYAPATSQASVTTSKPPANTGPRVWVYVYNDETSTAFAQGHIIMRDASITTYDGLLATANAPAIRLLGVAQHAIAAGSYGWILKRGIGEVQASDGGDDQDDTALVPAGSGQGHPVNTGTAAEIPAIFAWATENQDHGSASAAAGDLMTCWINCLG
tara:strand:+ start:2301 stop:2840 length:540 start_codon:yes stop_codon:yes gene_type:complete